MKFFSIRWKIIGILIISNILIGVALVVFINRTVSESLSTELIERGRTIGANLAQYSAEQIIEEDRVGLRQLITSGLTFESVEYILIQKPDGDFLSDTYNGQVPEELGSQEIPDAESMPDPQDVHLENSNLDCFDIWIPVEDGYLGYIRVGMKKDYVIESVNHTTKIILLTILGITLFGVIFVVFLANLIINPISYLTKRADEISQGKLEEKVVVSTHDEIGRLADALERLRESVKMALDRLKKHQTMRM